MGGNMRTKKFALVTLFAVALSVLGIAVAPKVALALHPLLNVHFEVDWDDFGGDRYDVDAHVELYDSNWNLLAGWSVEMNGEPNFVDWDIQLTNVPDEAIHYRIVWDYRDNGWISDPPVIHGTINWANPSISRHTRAEDPEP
jgi:hypothetical protein